MHELNRKRHGITQQRAGPLPPPRGPHAVPCISRLLLSCASLCALSLFCLLLPLLRLPPSSAYLPLAGGEKIRSRAQPSAGPPTGLKTGAISSWSAATFWHVAASETPGNDRESKPNQQCMVGATTHAPVIKNLRTRHVAARVSWPTHMEHQHTLVRNLTGLPCRPRQVVIIQGRALAHQLARAITAGAYQPGSHHFCQQGPIAEHLTVRKLQSRRRRKQTLRSPGSRVRRISAAGGPIGTTATALCASRNPGSAACSIASSADLQHLQVSWGARRPVWQTQCCAPVCLDPHDTSCSLLVTPSDLAGLAQLGSAHVLMSTPVY